MDTHLWIELIDEVDSLSDLPTDNRTANLDTFVDRVCRDPRREVCLCRKLLRSRLVTLEDEKVEDEVVQVAFCNVSTAPCEGGTGESDHRVMIMVVHRRPTRSSGLGEIPIKNNHVIASRAWRCLSPLRRGLIVD